MLASDDESVPSTTSTTPSATTNVSAVGSDLYESKSREDTKISIEANESKYGEEGKNSTPKPAAAAASTNAPVSAATAGTSLSVPKAARADVELSIIPERGQVLKGVRNVLKVLCQIKPPKKDTERPPFHIAVVLDKSGSMGVENRLRNSKRAVRKLIKHMQPETDRLHFITYDSNVTTVFVNGDLRNKDVLDELVSKVTTGTCTNLMAGLATGFKVLCEHSEPKKKNSLKPIKRIFLFSDGLVNKGVRSPAAILSAVDGYVRDGVQVTSFGIGSNFDLKLMTDIATRGRGDYFYLKADEITKLVSKSIHRLLSVSGTEVQLRLRGRNGFVVREICGHDESSLVTGAMLGDLHHGSEKRVLVTLEGAPSDTQVTGVVMEAALDYKPVSASPASASEGSNPASSSAKASASGKEIVAQRVENQLVLQFVADAADLGTRNQVVAVMDAVQRSVALDKQAEQALQNRRKDQAIRIKQQSIEVLENVLALLTKSSAAAAPSTANSSPTSSSATAVDDGNGDGNDDVDDDEENEVSDLARVQRLLAKATDTLRQMRESHDLEGIQRQMQYNNQLAQQMSDDDIMLSAEDSDEGDWSDDDDDGHGSAHIPYLPPSMPSSNGSNLQSNLAAIPCPQSGDDYTDGSDTDSDYEGSDGFDTDGSISDDDGL